MKGNFTGRLLLLLFLTTVSTSSFGQRMPVTTTIKTPHGNIPYTYYVGSPINYGQLSISARYEFKVVLQNDSSFRSKTKIDLNESDDDFISVKRNGISKKIFPKDTKYISRITADGKVLKGIPADSCWLFKTTKGVINGYSFLAEDVDDFLIAIQDGDDGPIIPFTKENLMPLVMDEEKSYQLASRNKLQRALTRYNYQAFLKQRTVSK